MKHIFGSSNPAMLAAIGLITAGSVVFALVGGSYFTFVVALVALTTIVGVGLNILVGLTGQISLGHVGFYAIGAYAVAILNLNGVNFWLAFLAAGVLAGAVGALLALPAMRVSGPYLAMVTIAFGFIVEHGIIEMRDLTGGQNGLMGFAGPSLGDFVFTEREMAILAIVLAGLALVLFDRIARSGWGRAMIAVRDAEIAARSVALHPLVIKVAAFAISAALTGLAGALYAPLMMYIAPSSFILSQSIIFLFAVIVGGIGWTLGPVVGAVVTVLLPELLSGLAEYRLLCFGIMLLVVLWLAPSGIVGALSRFLRKPKAESGAEVSAASVTDFLRREKGGDGLTVSDIGITFGGIRAASGVSLNAPLGRVTSIIGPNGAGKTTVLNMIGCFYRPNTGSIRIGAVELAGRSATVASRAGISRTYQTTKLFPSLSVLDNVLIGLRRGHLGNPVAALAQPKDTAIAAGLLRFVGYEGSLNALAADLPHVDRRLVEIARALALRPAVLLLDEPAAGLVQGEKNVLSRLLRQIADLGIAVVLVEHDMGLVMGISDELLVLDAGKPISSGDPAKVRKDPAVIAAYLGSGELKAKPRPQAWRAPDESVLAVDDLCAGYGSVGVLKSVDIKVGLGEMVALLGANGAGKSTTMRALSGLLRPVDGKVVLGEEAIERLPAHEIARRGLALVPEGRQIFPEFSVLDNIRIGAFRRGRGDYSSEIEALLCRFPRLRERLHLSAGLLSGGEQQMLAVARGLMAKPRILLLDEPSLGLAPQMIEELFSVLADLRDQGVTILLVDQMAALTLAVADRGYVLEQGALVRADTADALRGDPALEAAYLGNDRVCAEAGEKVSA
ncbi:MAG: ATP-binding cassette domain-containing protein [Xanthobacteraceae bacterium]|jgi:ABC-type branched-subunit amino acid transport system ATPase component/ABC-type branched-subunit amino acid transport system permease subunit|uniref:branched-chain amino acid ABC transporter ATP-binding protein/permease n=1 Tax=Pseudolabrys sp. TaxID=1960880 RepID=UPI003D131A38